jgi:ferredoxin
VKNREPRISEFSGRDDSQLTIIDSSLLIPLPPPYDQPEMSELRKLSDDQLRRFSCNLDGFIALGLPVPRDAGEEQKCITLFINGLKKLLSQESNWTFLQPLLLSLDFCARCQTCSESCHVYLASGRNPLYRPSFRSEIFRRLVGRYARKGGALLSRIRGEAINLNWTTISRLYELSYRCNLCRRCAQACPMGVDNALITREIRKLFSQELGWAPQELHEKGTQLQLKVGSPTGM